MSIPAAFHGTVRRIVKMLVAGDYAGLEQASQGVRLTADQLREGVLEYGRTLVMPSEASLQKLDVVEVKGAVPRRWGVRVDLWTAEEGRSDLTLELTLVEGDGGGEPAVEIDDLHVL